MPVPWTKIKHQFRTCVAQFTLADFFFIVAFSILAHFDILARRKTDTAEGIPWIVFESNPRS